MLSLFMSYFYREYRDQFYSPWLWISVLISSLGNLFIYWCTSKAFGANAEFAQFVQTDYFTFVLLGEMVVLIPLVLLTAFSQSLRSMVEGGTMDIFLSSPVQFFRTIFMMAISVTALQLCQLGVTLFLAMTFFSVNIEVSSLPLYLMLLASTLPFYCGLGLINGAFVLWLRRGDSALLSLAGIITVASGVYFPIEVFPKFFISVLKSSPLASLLEMSRNILTGNGGANLLTGDYLGLLIQWIPLGAITFIFGYFLFDRAIVLCRERGESQVLWK